MGRFGLKWETMQASPDVGVKAHLISKVKKPEQNGMIRLTGHQALKSGAHKHL
jgi:hypothetical protein